MDVPGWVWAVTVGVILVMLAVDFLGHARKAHIPSLKESGAWSAAYVLVALAFGVVVWQVWGAEFGQQYFSGYVLEKSLSVDNLFVFVLILSSFRVPRQFQQKVLLVGIVIALALRTVFIFIGAAAVNEFSWIFYIFGAFLIWVAIGQVKRKPEGEEEYQENAFLRLVRRVFRTTDDYVEDKLLVRQQGKVFVTPMLIVMLAIGSADVLFAVDSIPAIFTVTQETYLVFTANAFALLGLRQLYFLIDGLLDRLVYLHYGLAAILTLIGAKAIIHALNQNDLPFINDGDPITVIPEIPTNVSLLVVLGILIITTVLSVTVGRPRQAEAPKRVLRAPMPIRRWLASLLAVAGGVLTNAAFPDRSIWPLAFVGIALLVVAIGRNSARWAMLMGVLWGMAFFLPHLWWAHYAVGPVPWVALSLSQSLFVGAALAGWAWVRRAVGIRRWRLWGALPFAMIWVIAEQVRQVWPFGGFPWGRLAFSQAEGPLLALASIGGAPLVSGAVAATGFLLAVTTQEVWRVLRPKVAGPHRTAKGGQELPDPHPSDVATDEAETRAHLQRSFAGGGVMALIVAGSALIPLPTHAEQGTIAIGAVQGNVSTPGLGAFANALEVLDNHVRGTEDLVENTELDLDLVVWPENSSDYNPREDWSTQHLTAREGVDRAVEIAGVPLLMGTDRYADDVRYNEMVLWEPGAGDTFAYAKQIPAAFAEYIPMRDFARLFSPAVDLVGTDMAPGDQRAVVPVPVDRLGRDVVVGTPICFEVAYDALNREAVVHGAEVLLVPTNNASFGFTAESTQQLAMSQLRAVEHGRATIQISTVGVSGVISPDGQVSQRTELFTPAQLAAELPLRSTLTIADRLGDWPIILTTIAVVVLLGLGIATGRGGSTGREDVRGATASPHTPPEAGADADSSPAPSAAGRGHSSPSSPAPVPGDRVAGTGTSEGSPAQPRKTTSSAGHNVNGEAEHPVYLPDGPE